MPIFIDSTRAPVVADAVIEAFARMHPNVSADAIRRVFVAVERLFTGGHPDYLACDLAYHGFKHTLQVAMAFTDIQAGRHATRGGDEPRLSARQFELGLTAALLHDSGYLKLKADSSGTGAKYTYCHVLRSCALAASLLPTLGFALAEIDSVVSAIRCTGPTATGVKLKFRDSEEQFLACSVASADYLAQMASDDYPNQLGFLYAEFHESDEFVGTPVEHRIFKSPEDLVARTPAFWANVVLPKLDKDFLGIYRFLQQPDGFNPYLTAIEANLARIAATAASIDR